MVRMKKKGFAWQYIALVAFGVVTVLVSQRNLGVTQSLTVLMALMKMNYYVAHILTYF